VRPGGPSELAELKPLRDKEHALLKKRNALAQARVKGHPPVKSKEEAKILSHEIKAGRALMKERRAVYAAQRQAAVDQERTAQTH